ncbi:MAG: pyridoxal phosphate-dependent aminotransferase [Planctomycetota bacterium]
MPISNKVKNSLGQSSWIRRMFEEGARLKQQFGADQVYDFTLGNPDLPPPREFDARLRALINAPPTDLHRYMPNAGWPEVRAKIAAAFVRRTGLAYQAGHVVMTVGAGGGLNVCIKALLDPGDEIILLTPYFVEYLFYADNHAARAVVVPTTSDFGLDVDAIEQAITERTRAIIVNSPNNPTGRIYRHNELAKLAAALETANERYGRPIYLIADEPYRKIVYEDCVCPEVPPLYDHTIVVTSHSKDLGLAGERIGMLVVSPRAADATEIVDACTFANRTLGFVNAPSLFQLAVADCQDVTVDVATYQARRDLLVTHLSSLGFDVPVPGGAFYLFPRSPEPDEIAFTRRLLHRRILVVPSCGFGCSGHVRISYAVDTKTIERSLPIWTEVAAEYGLVPRRAARPGPITSKVKTSSSS